MRTEYDLEMMQEMGFCSGIENYSRHIAGRPPGSRPTCVIDFFPSDYLLVIDESHATIPQIGGMYAGDMARKTVLVEHGFRLPSALDNRPLNFEEFQSLQGQTIYVSATPGEREIWNGRRAGSVELVVRPTGSDRSEDHLKPLQGQIDDLIEEVRKRVELKERVLVTTLTKRTAEELTDYLRDIGINVRYLHSEIDAIERVEILRALAQRRVRCAGRHQSAARRAGPAGSFARGHSGCGQGRLSAQRHESDPDRGPRGASSEWRGDSVCGRDEPKAFRNSWPFPNIAGRSNSPTTRRTTSRRAA